ncbi:hypothetical protein L1987_23303 [Smallanthus sonchifolius]|uniref:Uncharacterized protein n=1 Tax=Smallanthus sonchifolius TaxID=185202 RepID=A0ACB9IIR7_9ASTR|nr:hypothetical protein L1987_23303 [Smallanthus sonchifolius]
MVSTSSESVNDGSYSNRVVSEPRAHGSFKSKGKPSMRKFQFKTNRSLRIEWNKDVEYMVKGIDKQEWNKMWFVSTTLKHHIAGNPDLFMSFMKTFGVGTRTNEDDILFIRGIEEIKINLNGVGKSIPVIWGPKRHRKHVRNKTSDIKINNGDDWSFKNGITGAKKQQEYSKLGWKWNDDASR